RPRADEPHSRVRRDGTRNSAGAAGAGRMNLESGLLAPRAEESGRLAPRVDSARGASRPLSKTWSACMIRTGYLRWEIEAEDRQSPQDRMAREIVFRARPTFRRVRVKGIGALARAAAENFRDGTGTFEEYQAAMA